MGDILFLRALNCNRHYCPLKHLFSFSPSTLSGPLALPGPITLLVAHLGQVQDSAKFPSGGPTSREIAVCGHAGSLQYASLYVVTRLLQQASAYGLLVL